MRLVIYKGFNKEFLMSLKDDDVIIDEAQDFENEEIEYFGKYTEHKNGHFLVFYDKNQLVTTKNVPDWIVESNCKLILTKNCRNTREIAITANGGVADSVRRVIWYRCDGTRDGYNWYC